MAAEKLTHAGILRRPPLRPTKNPRISLRKHILRFFGALRLAELGRFPAASVAQKSSSPCPSSYLKGKFRAACKKLVISGVNAILLLPSRSPSLLVPRASHPWTPPNARQRPGRVWYVLIAALPRGVSRAATLRCLKALTCSVLKSLIVGMPPFGYRAAGRVYLTGAATALSSAGLATALRGLGRTGLGASRSDPITGA